VQAVLENFEAWLSRQAGCSVGVLEAGLDGRSVYRALGFDEVCRLTFAVRA
jgi:hypothetical protein